MSALKKVYIIAGEASGDRLGAQAMAELKAAYPDVQFFGIGGPMMSEQGLESLFPMEELSIMGFIEIAPNLISILKRIKQTIQNIEEINPDLILTIDSPDFCFRVAKGVHKNGKTNAKLVHYVAPTVWAWREGRAKKIAGFLDGILCLLPFEPSYFEKEGLKANFVGHPVMQSGILNADGSVFREEAGIAQNEKTLGVFLGSRRAEIKRLGPVIRDALFELADEREKLHLIVPTLPHLKDQVFKCLKDYPGPLHITVRPDLKWHAFKACDAAIAVSGTVGLELAIANVPHLIAFNMTPMTWEIVKRVVKVRHAHLANILMDDDVVPEFIQPNCKVNLIAEKAHELLNDSAMQDQQRSHFQTVRDKISPQSKTAISDFVDEIL
ncbi:MAG: lipid-A-disaccharide synthase [Pseudomonadota bacterium]